MHPQFFRALVEATAFGSKKIIDRFVAEGIPIEGIIALGGVAKKSPFVMQVVADVIDKPILVARSEQACALVLPWLQLLSETISDYRGCSAGNGRRF